MRSAALARPRGEIDEIQVIWTAKRVQMPGFRRLPGDGGYHVSDVHCTRGGRYAYFGSVRTTRYFCIARLADGGDCDLFQVDARPDGSAAVTRVRRGAGCVLPAG